MALITTGLLFGSLALPLGAQVSSAPDTVRVPDFIVPDLPDGVEVIVEVEEYDPATAAGRELIRNIPPHSGPRTGPPAFTEYSIRPSWTPAAEGGTCRASATSVTVAVQVKMPIGVSVSEKVWLRRHENGHLRLIVEHSVALFDRMNALEGATCPRLSWRAEALVRRVDRELAQAHAWYDGRGQQ